MSTEINIKKKLAILNEGANVTTDASSIDFVGSGVNTSTVGNDVTVTIPGGSGNTTYYMNATVPETPYAQFSSVATTAVEQVLPWTVDPGDTETAFVFQTPSGVPNTTQIPGGLWQFFLHFNSLGVNENWIIRPTVYKRDLGGTETLLFTADPQIINNLPTVTTMYVCDGVFPATTLLTTDRLVVKIALQNTGVSTQTLNFRTEGSQHYSVAFTTLNQVISGGSVTSVTGTAPIVSSGGLTPAISIPLATGSVNGYLSSSDWSTFSAKLGGSGTINRLSKWISSTALGNSLFEDDGTSIAIGTNPSASIKLDVYSTLVQSIRGVNGSTSVGNKTAIEGTANGANGTNIGGYFYAQNATNNYSIWLQDGTQAVGKVLTCITSDGKANWATPASASGVCGIANSSGVYTYYATLTLAMTAATSGQTIELFSDITETASVTITLKNGVNINGNGHTYTLSVNDGTNAFTGTNLQMEFYNLKAIRTGRANGSGGYVLLSSNVSLTIIKCYGTTFINTFGESCVLNNCNLYGINAIGYYNAITDYGASKIYNAICESNGLGYGISTSFGFVYNSIGIAVSTSGILCNGEVYESVGISTSGIGIEGQKITNSTGISTSGTALSSNEARNCVGISTSGLAGSGTFYDSTLISSSNYAITGGGAGGKIYNSYAQSTSSPTTLQTNIYNSTVRCLWNNAGGNCTTTFAVSSFEILNSFLEVTNASAYCITGYIGSTWKYSNNSFKGSTTAVNATNITQGITNTSDNQGNILI